MTDANNPRRVLHHYKVPYGLNGRWGPTNAEPGTLAQINTLRAKATGAFHGQGYLPDIEDPLACLDCDDTSNPHWPGLLETTYCERSPSNLPTKGHALVTLNRAAKERLKGIRKIAGFELFSDSSFFTVTFNALNNLPLADYSNRLCNLADRLNLYPPVGGTPNHSCYALPIEFHSQHASAIDPNCSWNDWFQAIAAVHCATGGSEEGKALCHEWGRSGGKYNDASMKKIEKDWPNLDDSKCRYTPDTTLEILAKKHWRQGLNTRVVIPDGWAKAPPKDPNAKPVLPIFMKEK